MKRSGTQCPAPFSASGRRIGRSFAEVVAKVIAHICEFSVLIVQVQMRLKIRVQYELHTQLSILLMQIGRASCRERV